MHTKWVYAVNDHGVDVADTKFGIAYRLNWDLDEDELALYESTASHGSLLAT